MSERLSRRFTEHFAARPEAVRALDADHPAVVDGHTMFPSRVRNPRHNGIVLISGANQRKIGDKVRKGPWAGMPIFTLTLEERATCPRTCHHWRTCYGNGMPWPERHEAGLDLEHALSVELAYLARRHTQGFAVRLHILGDFYSQRYVQLWWSWLDQFPQLHVWGYTARARDSEIGREVAKLNSLYPSRWFVRFSVGKLTGKGGEATTIWREDEPTSAIVCPVQTGKTDACATCGLCWAIPTQGRDIAFIGHGMKSRAGQRMAPVRPIQSHVLNHLRTLAGRWVSTEDLIEAVFHEDPDGGPDQADAAVKRAIMSLRKRGVVIEGRRGSNGGYRVGRAYPGVDVSDPPFLPPVDGEAA